MESIAKMAWQKAIALPSFSECQTSEFTGIMFTAFCVTRPGIEPPASQIGSGRPTTALLSSSHSCVAAFIQGLYLIQQPVLEYCTGMFIYVIVFSEVYSTYCFTFMLTEDILLIFLIPHIFVGRLKPEIRLCDFSFAIFARNTVHSIINTVYYCSLYFKYSSLFP